MTNPTTPVVQDLTMQPLSALVDLTQTADSDGFYFRQGDLLEIDADGKVKKLTAGGVYFGQAKTSIHENQAPNGLDADHRLAVLTKYKQLTKMNCTGAVAAGGFVVPSAGTANKVMAATALTVSIDAASTAVLSTAANGDITTIAGGLLPQIILGQCWVGGTDTEIQVLS